MRVAFIGPETLPIPPIKGGAVEIWIHEVMQKLPKSYELYCFTIYDDKLLPYEQQENIKYFRFRAGIIAKVLLCSYKLPFKKSSSYLYWLPYSIWCAWQLSRIKPDIIHIHNRIQFVSIIKFLNPKAKIILHIHQLSVLKPKNLWNSKVCNKIDLFLACSKFLAAEIRKEYPFISRITHSYNGYDDAKFSPHWSRIEDRLSLRNRFNIAQGEKVILYVGRFAENKGLHLLIEAFHIINKRFDNVKLVIAGDVIKGYLDLEEYGRRIKDLTERVAKERIIFLGRKSSDEIADYYLLGDIIVIPSIVKEGLGNVAIEAMATGLPVVTSGRGGLQELTKHESTGLLVPAIENVDKLAESIERLLKDDQLSATLGRNGYAFVRDKFTWETISKEVIELYETELERCNILYYDPSSGFGGSSKFLVHLVNHLDIKRFYPVVAITKDGPNFQKINNAILIRLKGFTEEKQMSYFGFFLLLIRQIIPEAFRLYRAIRRNKVALVHSNVGMVCALPAVIAAKLANIPCVCHVHYSPKKIMKREKLILPWVTKLIVLNKDTLEMYKRNVDSRKLELIYNGLNSDEIVEASVRSFREEFNLNGFPVVSLIGRIVEGKGHKEFILAAKEVLSLRPEVRFLIIGDEKGDSNSSGYFEEARNLTRKENLERNVIFTGWRNDVNSIIVNTDILVQASTTFPEGFPITLIEAMAFGKPIVATKITGHCDAVLDGKTGFLVSPGDSAEMANKILWLLNNPKSAKEMGEWGRKRFEEMFAINQVVNNIEKVYKDSIAGWGN